jgi:hypothetical protein
MLETRGNLMHHVKPEGNLRPDNNILYRQLVNEHPLQIGFSSR